jgi:DNA-binding response OmpR family regulator
MPGREHPRVLVVEDEKKVAQFITQALEEEDYVVDAAHDGEQGLALAQAGRYDVIVLDVMLPRMTGLEMIREFRARSGSLLRRGTMDKTTLLGIADLELDTVSHRARRGGKEIELTAKEYALLEFFLRNRGRVLSRTSISEQIWRYNFDTGTNIIDVYVNHLRNKIDEGFEPRLIHTVRGVGYVMRES